MGRCVGDVVYRDIAEGTKKLAPSSYMFYTRERRGISEDSMDKT